MAVKLKKFLCLDEERKHFTLEAPDMEAARSAARLWNATVACEIKPQINPRTDPDKYMEAYGNAGEHG